MRTLIQRFSFSPAVRADMTALGVHRARRSAGPMLIVCMATFDVATALLSLIAP